MEERNMCNEVYENVVMRKKERRLMNKITKIFGKGYMKACKAVNDFTSEERGASELVVLVGLIVITLAVIIVFRGQLTNIINAVGTKVMNWINAN